MAKLKKPAVIEVDQTVEILQHKKRAFLAAYSQCGNVTKAAELADIARQTHYDWLTADDEGYKKAFAYADEQAGDYLEQEARRRAVEGVDEPVFYQGVECGTVRKYSDTLLIFLLNGSKPEKYKQRVANEHSGKIDHGDIERMDDSAILSGIEATIQAIADLQERVGAKT